MGFFKNINTDIEDRPAGSKVQIGDVGKTIYTKTYSTGHRTSRREEGQHITPEDIFKISTDINMLPLFDEDRVYFGLFRDSYKMHNCYRPSSCIKYIPYGSYILLTNYNIHVERYERFYKVEKISNHPDAARLKRPDTIIRHACKDCAFYGRCVDAPSCITKYIKEICNSNDQRLIKNAIYFKYNKKNDKLIDNTITPQTREDERYVRMDEWLESMPSDQRIKYQEVIKLFKN